MNCSQQADYSRTMAVLDELYSFPDPSKRIQFEREEVLRLLSSENPPHVYGFNSLLGDLDKLPTSSSDQEKLLELHLQGDAQEIPGCGMRLLAAVKARQLAEGGSGISPEAYSAVAEAAKSWTGLAVGNWHTSYSSGDVVQGSWFAKNLFDRHLLDTLRPGDLISIINGNFVSTAAGIIALTAAERLEKFVFDELELTIDSVTARSRKDIQLPVSLRDRRQLQDVVMTAAQQLSEALMRRVSQSSGNPLFEFGDGVLPRSNSSFLDFRLTLAIESCQSALNVCAAYVRGLALYVVAHARDSVEKPLQPAKVFTAANSVRLDRSIGNPGGFSVTESDGVEDICDRSLQSALQFVHQVDAFSKSMALLDALFEYVDIPKLCMYRSPELRSFDFDVLQQLASAAAK